jgi:hypothetical protein
LGLTNFKGITPTKQETEIAKNYLNEKELNIFERGNLSSRERFYKTNN